MARRILLETGTPPQVLEEVAVPDEETLQERLKDSPGLVPIEDFGMIGPLLVIGRETTLPSGSVDLVALARSGDLLIIEFKTGPHNPDFRRATSQLVDYGSDIWQMSMDVFESTVPLRYFKSSRCPEGAPGAGAASLHEAALATWPDMTEDEWSEARDHLEQQLNSGAFIFVVVAQRFTASSERTIRYLNETAKSSFFAVELVRFKGASHSAFEARTVYRPQPQMSQPPVTSEVAFLESVEPPPYRAALEDLLDTCRGVDLRFAWGTRGTSIRLPTIDSAQPLTIGWLFPPGRIGWSGLSYLTLGFDAVSAESRPSVRNALERYVTSLGQLPHAEAVNRKNLRALEFGPGVLETNLPAIKEIFGVLVQVAASP